MRVLHVLNFTKGGATLGALEYVKASLRSGEGLVHYAVYPGRPGRPDPAIHSVFEDAEAIPLPAWNRPRNLGFGSRILLAALVARHTAFGMRTMRCLAEAIRQWRIDLVTTNCAANIHGAFAARRAGLPHVWHIRERIGTGGSMEFRLDDRRLVQRIAALSDGIAAVSEYVAEPFRRCGADTTLEVVYDGVDVEAFQSPLANDRGRQLREQWGIAKNAVLVGYVANVTAHVKRHDLFLWAASEVARHHGRDEVRFVVVGALPTRDTWFNRPGFQRWQRLKAMAHDLALDDRLAWAGGVDDPPAIMNAIDIMAHACPIEGFPRVVIEAMAAGKPVVAPSAGGIPEEVADAGVMVDPGSPEALACGIDSLLGDSEKRKNFGATGLRRVTERFSSQGHAMMMSDLYKRMVGLHSSDTESL